MDNQENKKVIRISKKVTIKRVNPDNVRPTYANDFIVTHTEKEFFLTFSLLEPIGLLDPKEIEKYNEIEANAVCKIVMSPAFIDLMMKALSVNYDNYKKQINEHK